MAINSFKECNLKRFNEQEMVFSSKDDFKKALKELKSENEILVTFKQDGIKRTELVSTDVLTKFRNDELEMYAEEKIGGI